PADLHARDALLPAPDEVAERELNRLTAAPRGVELLERLEVDTEVVHLDGVAGRRLLAGALDDVHDHEVGRRVALVELHFGLAAHIGHAIQSSTPSAYGAAERRSRVPGTRQTAAPQRTGWRAASARRRAIWDSGSPRNTADPATKVSAPCSRAIRMV